MTATALRVVTRDDDDTALAVAAGGGDAAAFTRIYQRYADRVFGRLTTMIGPAPEREDLLQQVFLGLHRSLPTFRGEASLSTFLYRITVNVACEHLRRRRRRGGEHDPVEIDRILDDDLSPEERTRKRQELAEILGYLERIKPDKRIAFTLVALEGLSHAEVADLVGATPDAVKQRVLHARRELMAMIERADARRAPRGGDHA